MCDIYPSGLTIEQQKVHDLFTQAFEHYNVLRKGSNVSLVCDAILGYMILLPEEIEEIVIGNGKR